MLNVVDDDGYESSSRHNDGMCPLLFMEPPLKI
jgi:hypothetical protein